MTTKIEFLKELVKANDLVQKEDLFDLKRGGKSISLICRTGIEKIQYNNEIDVKFQAEVLKENFAVIKATATKGDVVIETYASALCGSGGNSQSNYVAEMAEKRALSRAVLKITGAYKHGVYGQDEADDFTPPEVPEEKAEPEKKAREKPKANGVGDGIFVAHDESIQKISSLKSLQSHWEKNVDELKKLKTSHPEIAEKIQAAFNERKQELTKEG